MRDLFRKNILLVTCSYGKFPDSHSIRLRNLLERLDIEKYNLEIMAPGPKSALCPIINESAKETFTRLPLQLILIDYLNYKNFKRINWFVKNIVYRLGFPDHFMGWNRIGLKSTNRIKMIPDFILSASGSPEAHMLAAKLKSKFKCKWIADYGDPWSSIDMKIRPYYSKISVYLEKKLLNDADAIVFTTMNTKNEYISKFNVKNPTVIPYGFNLNDFKPNNIVINNPYFSISHIGTAHVSDRDLRPLISASDQLVDVINDLELIIYGKHSMEFDKSILRSKLKKFKLKQLVPYQEALNASYNSDIQIIVGNINGSQVPGKIFINLLIPKPILYLKQCCESKDEALGYLLNFKGIAYCENNEVDISKKLIQIKKNYLKFKKESIERTKSDSLLKLESKNLFLDFDKLIKCL